MSESSSLAFETPSKSRSTNNIAVAAALATYAVTLPSNKSSTSLLTTNSTHRLKILKQHNLELEQHLRQQQKKDQCGVQELQHLILTSNLASLESMTVATTNTTKVSALSLLLNH